MISYVVIMPSVTNIESGGTTCSGSVWMWNCELFYFGEKKRSTIFPEHIWHFILNSPKIELVNSAIEGEQLDLDSLRMGTGQLL